MQECPGVTSEGEGESSNFFHSRGLRIFLSWANQDFEFSSTREKTGGDSSGFENSDDSLEELEIGAK